jgi:glyoxylase-like metal-dependent hydrolase (beta-lactamase superfamily II)
VSKSVAQEHNRVKEKPLEQMVPSQPLEILPRSRVWLGYIDVATNKKYQKTFSDALDLDADKEWLLLFGHGYVDLIVNGEKIHFSEKNNLRLHYKDGMLEKISLAEFKKINRGRKW